MGNEWRYSFELSEDETVETTASSMERGGIEATPLGKGCVFLCRWKVGAKNKRKPKTDTKTVGLLRQAG